MHECGTQCTTRLRFWALLFLLRINDLIANVQGTKMVLCAEDNFLITGRDEFELQQK
jgi:hypothetical protein